VATIVVAHALASADSTVSVTSRRLRSQPLLRAGNRQVRFAGPGDPKRNCREFAHDMIPAISNHSGHAPFGDR
jgi:hypothetical protein